VTRFKNMLLGHFTKLQTYSVPVNNVQLAKRQVKQVSFKDRRNGSKEFEFRMSGGRLCQARTAATENARSPSVVRRLVWISKNGPVSHAERNIRRSVIYQYLWSRNWRISSSGGWAP